jgi:hypothetical protein
MLTVMGHPKELEEDVLQYYFVHREFEMKSFKA